MVAGIEKLWPDIIPDDVTSLLVAGDLIPASSYWKFIPFQKIKISNIILFLTIFTLGYNGFLYFYTTIQVFLFLMNRALCRAGLKTKSYAGGISVTNAFGP